MPRNAVPSPDLSKVARGRGPDNWLLYAGTPKGKLFINLGNSKREGNKLAVAEQLPANVFEI